jgi:hypothetical protein
MRLRLIASMPELVAMPLCPELLPYHVCDQMIL